jgi:hypothetical protein
MAMWLYQLSQNTWPVNNYRLDIWEGERWCWEVRRVVGDDVPVPGDTIYFFYVKADCPAPGFYAWAVVLQCVVERDDRRIYFRPVAPSDQLKMCPWWDGPDGSVQKLVTQIRGAVARGTLWRVPDELVPTIGRGIARWVSGQGATE